MTLVDPITDICTTCNCPSQSCDCIMPVPSLDAIANVMRIPRERFHHDYAQANYNSARFSMQNSIEDACNQVLLQKGDSEL